MWIMAEHNLGCALCYWDELEPENLRGYIEVAQEWLLKLREEMRRCHVT